ncbi:S8 family peptidase [bacterium]|nr:S8 family peptidase [bacterium]
MSVFKRFGQGLIGLLMLVFAAQAGPILYVLPTVDDAYHKQDRVSELRSLPGVVEARIALPQTVRQEANRLDRWLRVELSSSEELEDVRLQLMADEGIEWVEETPVRTVSADAGLDATCNDPLAAFQWHLDHVNAFAAWDVAPDAEGVVVAVVDNGVDMDHPDLQPILWVNQAERDGRRNIDDDENGYIDDFFGWDSYSNDGDPNAPTNVSSRDHGTHCSGIAVGAHNNRVGISGIAPGARLMAIRAGQGSQIGSAVEGIVYAVDNGARVLSMSFSGGGESAFERDAIRYAAANDVVLIAASGNEGQTALAYPAAYEEVIGVAAVDLDNQITSYSNTGPWVDIAAPGSDILSTVIDGYGYSTGTSMATPLVAGIAALIIGEDPDLSADAVKARLLSGSIPLTDPPNAGYPTRRVDAWRTALSDRPTVVVNNLDVVDGDEDGVLELGEDGSLTLELELIGRSASEVSISCTSTDGGLQADFQEGWTDLEPGLFTSRAFTIHANSSGSRGFAPLTLDIQVQHEGANGSLDTYRSTTVVDIPVDPKWRTHDAGEMVASITDFGAIGYRDYVNNKDRAEGIRLTERSTGFLFHGSVMVAQGANVSDCAFGNNSQNIYDFFTTSAGEIRQVATAPSQVVYSAQYTDGAAFGTAGVLVDQTSISYPNGEEIVYVDLDVTPIAGNNFTYDVGLYCDWDIGGAYNNTVRYNSTEKLSYILGPNGAAGIKIIGDTPVGVAAIDNEAVVYNGFTDTEKAQLMTSGTENAEFLTAGDMSHIVAVRLEGVTVAEPGRASFAILAAESESALLGLAKRTVGGEWDGNVTIPGQFSLSNAWPNPFNSSASTIVNLPEAGRLEVVVHDLLGRRVAVLADNDYLAGRHRLVWDGRSSSGLEAASGTYFVRAGWNDRWMTRRITLVR